MENYKNGEYEFVLLCEDTHTIRIKFTIDSNGTVLYNEPIFL